MAQPPRVAVHLTLVPRDSEVRRPHRVAALQLTRRSMSLMENKIGRFTQSPAHLAFSSLGTNLAHFYRMDHLGGMRSLTTAT